MGDLMEQSFNYDFNLMIAGHGVSMAIVVMKVIIVFLLCRFLDHLTGMKFDETKREIYNKANVAVAVYRGFWVVAISIIVGLSG